MRLTNTEPSKALGAPPNASPAVTPGAAAVSIPLKNQKLKIQTSRPPAASPPNELLFVFLRVFESSCLILFLANSMHPLLLLSLHRQQPLLPLRLHPFLHIALSPARGHRNLLDRKLRRPIHI